MLIGNAVDFPVGSFSIAAGLFFLGRDAQGIYVMSMQCTHKGCAVAVAGEALQCPCHQARFDRTGNVLGGPAPAPLPHFAVYVDADGNISVDRFTVVSSSTRTPV
jgi:Rieske Fe-S protein